MEIVSALRLALADKVGQDRFDLWFGNHTCLDYDNEAVTVRVPNQFYQDWLRTNFRRQIEASCFEAIGKQVPVRFHIDPELEQKTARGAPACTTAPTACGAIAKIAPPEPPATVRRKLATLDSFVAGPSNRLAWVAAQTTASRLGASSPLVLHGPTSVGKTHLLEGIVSEVRRLRSGSQAVYLSAEQFTTLFLDALHGRGLPLFRRKYRGLDLLIVDDIQFLVGKRATLTELLHTIDTFAREGRQLVFAADRPPNELMDLGQDFTTRLQSGLVCGIEPPEFETRLGITRRLAERMGIVLSGEVQQLVASRVTTHAREISGALNRLDATSRALDQPIDAALAEQTLTDVRRQSRSVRLADINQAVCDVFGLEPETLQSETKAKHVSQPRMLAMWLARRYTRAAFSEIGSYFGKRSHSTVISAQKKVDNWVESHLPLELGQGQCAIDEAIRRIEQSLRAS